MVIGSAASLCSDNEVALETKMNIKIYFASLVLMTLASSAFADTYVEGYYRSDGSYVAPHYRSDPNHTKRDNWSTEGNYNPYTGERGTKRVCGYGNNTYYC